MEKTDQFIHIKSPKFSVLPGEEEELVNPGMYGKALGQYVKESLNRKGTGATNARPEDWGWWVDIEDVPFEFGVCIYCGPGEDHKLEYACLVGVRQRRVWSWKKFKSIDTTPWADKLYDDLLEMFEIDPDITVIGVTDACPVGAGEQEELPPS